MSDEEVETGENVENLVDIRNKFMSTKPNIPKQEEFLISTP